MAAIDRGHVGIGIVAALVLAILFYALAFLMGGLVFSILGAIASIALGLCILGWIYLYLDELDDRLKAIEGK